MNKKLVWADLIRIFGVYLIIVLHVTLVNESINPLFLPDLALINTNVPILVMLSGALLLNKKENYSNFFKKRVSRVVIPWIFWTAIFALFIAIYNQNDLRSIIGIFRSIFIPLFWFMTMLVGLYALTPAIRIFLHAAKEKDIWIVFSVWFILVSLLPYIRNTEAFPASPDNGLVRLIALFIGYYILGHQLIKIKKTKRNRNIFISLFIFGLFLFSFSYSLKIAGGYINYSLPSIVITSMSFFSLIYYFRDQFETISPKVKNSIMTLSKTTLGIFFIHFLFIERLPLPSLLNGGYIANFSPEINPFINGGIIFLISFVIIFALSKIPKMKNLIGFS